MTENTCKTEMCDDELVKLVTKYANYYRLKFKHIWKLYADAGDIYGELAETACRAREYCRNNPLKTASIRTYIVSAMRRRMENYRQYQYVRQVKYPSVGIKYC